jgi:hypothetical protein
MVNDIGGLLGACLGSGGIAQLLEIYARPLIEARTLEQLLPDWTDETFPLYAYHYSPKLISARVRAFLDFLAETVGKETHEARAASGLATLPQTHCKHLPGVERPSCAPWLAPLRSWVAADLPEKSRNRCGSLPTAIR